MLRIKSFFSWKTFTLIVLQTLLCVFTSVAGVQPSQPFTVIVSGLMSPRGLTFGPGDKLYVAEAGNGDGTAGSIVGNTGKISQILNPASNHPTISTIVSGIVSIIDEPDSIPGVVTNYIGVDGISAGLGNGNIAAITALSPLNVDDPGAAGNEALGNLLSVSRGGQVRTVAQVGSVDYIFTETQPQPPSPPGMGPQFPDANPYGVLALPGITYVVDAGSNTLDSVFPNGRVEVEAYIPNTPLSDAVPTCVAKGPDGMLYVGTLALVDSIDSVLAGGKPQAKVYRIDPASFGHGIDHVKMTVFAQNLWPINGCTFGPDGTFYASELFTSATLASPAPPPPIPPFVLAGGDVVAIGHDGTPKSLTGGTLPFPGGVAVASDGTVYAVGLSASFGPPPPPPLPSTGFVARLTNKEHGVCGKW